MCGKPNAADADPQMRIWKVGAVPDKALSGVKARRLARTVAIVVTRTARDGWARHRMPVAGFPVRHRRPVEMEVIRG
jgi:hypothetical protein